MKAKRHILIAGALLSGTTMQALPQLNNANAHQEIADTTELTTELDGIVVEASGRQMNDHGVSVIPNTNQKKAAYDCYDLVRRLGIPQLDMHPGDESIKTITGASVATFINYQPATAYDVAGLNPKDVVKVEYLQNPMDGRFAGQNEVVNFIVKEMNHGGYTRLQANTFIYGTRQMWLSAFSKFYTGKMTYDLYVGYEYNNSHHSGGEYTQWYTLTHPSGRQYEQIRKESTLRYRNRSYNLPVSFKASYNNDAQKLSFSNTLSYSWDKSPSQINEGLLQFSPGSEQDYNYWRSANSRGQSISWEGFLYKGFSHDLHLTIQPSLVYSHFDKNSEYTTSHPNQDVIINISEDRALNAALNLNLMKVWQNRYLLGVTGGFKYNHNKVDYQGSNPYVNRLGQYRSTIGIDFQYSGQTVSGQLTPKLLINSTRVNGETSTRVTPEINAHINWSPNNFHRLSANINYTSVTPSISEMSPNVLQENEFIYFTGNPDYHSYDNLVAYISHVWIFNRHFTGTVLAAYNYVDNLGQRLYAPYMDGQAIIRYPVNSGAYHWFMPQLRLRYTPNQSFAFEGMVRYLHDALEGVNHNHCNGWGYVLQAYYYYRNINVDLFFERTDKQLDINTGQFTTMPNFYGMNIGWSAKSWNVNLSLRNPFKYSWKNSHEFFSSPYYSYDNRTYGANAHCSVQLRVSYTFRYGKQKNDNSEIGAGSKAESGILK